jgi:hypothetical protein
MQIGYDYATENIGLDRAAFAGDTTSFPFP